MALLCLQIQVVLTYKNHLFKIVYILSIYCSYGYLRPVQRAMPPISFHQCPVGAQLTFWYINVESKYSATCYRLFFFFAFIQLVGPVSIHLYIYN